MFLFCLFVLFCFVLFLFEIELKAPSHLAAKNLWEFGCGSAPTPAAGPCCPHPNSCRLLGCGAQLAAPRPSAAGKEDFPSQLQGLSTVTSEHTGAVCTYPRDARCALGVLLEEALLPREFRAELLDTELGPGNTHPVLSPSPSQKDVSDKMRNHKASSPTCRRRDLLAGQLVRGGVVSPVPNGASLTGFGDSPAELCQCRTASGYLFIYWGGNK